MPEVDGFEFVHRLRAKQAWRDIPVIVFTAMSLTPDQRLQLESGVQKIVSKTSSAESGWVSEIAEMVRSCASRESARPAGTADVKDLVLQG
jgi:CheY-like chemotaxis protein